MGQYRIFAVCQLMAKAFAISQQTAKVPRGAQLCNLGSSSWPYSLFAVRFLGADGKEEGTEEGGEVGRRQRVERGGRRGPGRRQRWTWRQTAKMEGEGRGGEGRRQRWTGRQTAKIDGEADGKGSINP